MVYVYIVSHVFSISFGTNSPQSVVSTSLLTSSGVRGIESSTTLSLPFRYRRRKCRHQFNTWVILCGCHSQYWFLTSRNIVDLWYEIIFLSARVLNWMIPLCTSFSKWSCSCLKGKLELSSLCLPSLSTGLLDSWSALSGQSYSCCNSLALRALVILLHKKRKGGRFISIKKVGPVFYSYYTLLDYPPSLRQPAAWGLQVNLLGFFSFVLWCVPPPPPPSFPFHEFIELIYELM